MTNFSDRSRSTEEPAGNTKKLPYWLHFLTWSWWPILLTLSLAVSMLALLLWFVYGQSPTPPPSKPPPVFADIVEVDGKRIIRIENASPLEKKLTLAQVRTESVTSPLLNVTGSLVAKLTPGKEPVEERLQFSSSALLSAYTDWRNAAIDMDFAEGQAVKIRNLAASRVKAQAQVVERMRKLVAIGTDSIRDLHREEAMLSELELQGRKDVFEAENAIRLAENNRTALERQLLQEGIDPVLMHRLKDGTAVVVADVPEAKISLIATGRSCQARFYGFPDKLFNGRISNLAPILAKEQRTLRVLFELEDPQNHLRPGMFADIGLGTDPRPALFMPVDGLLHIERGDYVLTTSEPGLWEVQEVRVGELRNREIEVLSGLRDGEQVAGDGAILLKPLVAKIIQAAHKPMQPAQPISDVVNP